MIEQLGQRGRITPEEFAEMYRVAEKVGTQFDEYVREFLEHTSDVRTALSSACKELARAAGEATNPRIRALAAAEISPQIGDPIRELEFWRAHATERVRLMTEWYPEGMRITNAGKVAHMDWTSALLNHTFYVMKLHGGQSLLRIIARDGMAPHEAAAILYGATREERAILDRQGPDTWPGWGRAE